MPAARQDVEYAPPPKLSPWHRLLLRLPHLNSGQSKARLVDRLRNAALKPADPEAPAQSRGAYELSGEELEIEEKRANDKERAIGLLAGPLATLIAFLVVHDLVVNDPSATPVRRCGQQAAREPVDLLPSVPRAHRPVVRDHRHGPVAKAPLPGHRDRPCTGWRSSTFTTGASVCRSSWWAPGTWSGPTGCTAS